MLTPPILLSISGIQTRVVQKITHELSETLHTKVEIARVDLQFLGRIRIKNVLICDLQGDTLLTIDEIGGRMAPIALLRDELHFLSIDIEKPTANLQIEADGKPNFAFIAELFPQDSTAKPAIGLRFDKIQLKNGTVSFVNLKNWQKTASNKFDANNVRLTNLNLAAKFRLTREQEMQILLKSLQANEQSGLTLKNLFLQANIDDKKIILPKLNLELPHSQINFDTISVAHSELKRLVQSPDSVQIRALLQRSTLNLADLAAFEPKLARLRTDITLAAEFGGNLNNLNAQNLHVRYGDAMRFNGDFHFDGLPKIDETNMTAQLNEISLTTHSLQNLLAQITGKPVILPNEIHRLGKCRYSGKISGTPTLARLEGQLQTNAGVIRTNIAIRAAKDLSQAEITGCVKSDGVNLTQITPKKVGLGNVKFNADANVKLARNEPAEIVADLKIPTLEFRNHTYEQIAVNGFYTNNTFSGTVNVDDEFLKFAFDGQVDLNADSKTMNFDATIEHFRPYALNLISNNPNLQISSKIRSELIGFDIDNITSEIVLSDIKLDNDHSFYLPTLRFESATSPNGTHTCRIVSNLLNAKFSGRYKFASLGKSCQQMAQHYFPILGKNDSKSSLNLGNDVELNIDLESTESLAKAIDFQWFTPKNVRINAGYNDSDWLLMASVDVPQLINRTNGHYQNLRIDVDNRNNQLNCNAHAEIVDRKKSITTFDLNVGGANDSIMTHLSLEKDNKAPIAVAGELLFDTKLAKHDSTLNATIRLLPTKLTIQNTTFDIRSNEITTDFKSVSINDLDIKSNDQYIYIDGIASANENDSIYAELQNIDLEFISTLIPPVTPINFGGSVSGWASIRQAFNIPIITANVSSQSFSFNDAYLGSLDARSWWNNTQKGICFAGLIKSDAREVVTDLVGGYFFPNDSLDIVAKANHMNIKFIERFMQNIMQDLKGTASADVHIYGYTKTSNIDVEVEGIAENAQAKVGFLGSTFFFNDSIRLTPTEIRLPNIDVYDTEGNHALLDGTLRHRYFRNFDYRINIDFKNFLALNTTAKDNEIFYGKAHATGNASITGDDQRTNIRVNATTDRNTHLAVPIGASVASENSFVQFVSKKNVKETPEIDPDTQTNNDNDGELTLNMTMHVTPSAEVAIYIDPKTGDVLRANGEGDIRINYNDKTGDFKMYGDYEINQGSYLFSFQEAIRKEFRVKQGSSVSWNGNPAEPQVDVDGYYQLNASLLDILDQSYLESINRTTVPVQCLLNLNGQLSNPNLNFDITLPTSDEELNRALKATINTDEMMTREIIYLLVLGKFFTPETMKSNGTAFSENDLLAVASSTVSAQLNNWASQMFENWNFGVNFRRSDLGDSFSNEYEFNFLYTPNNRISINGNVGYRDDNLSASKFIGDFDFEYKLTESGKLSAKAYTHTNDYKEFKTALTTQGIGLVYRESFDTGKDLIDDWKTSIADDKRIRAERRERWRRRREERRAAREAKKAAANSPQTPTNAPADSIPTEPTDTITSENR